MKRREFLAMFAGAAADIAYPRRSHGQPRATPVIGFLSSLSEARAEAQLTNFRRGLSEVGFAEGRNLTIDFRWSEGRYELLPAMADDLVRRDVNLILARGPPAALAARASSTSIPTVFVVGFDPVAGGLVASLNQPGGNATGVTLMTAPLGQKRLELLREIAPKAGAVALLANPVSPDAARKSSTSRTLRVRSGSNSSDSTPPISPRSRRPSRGSSNSDPMPSSSVRTLSCWTSATRSPRSRRSFAYPPSIRSGNLPRPAGSSVMERASATPIDKRAFTPARFSRERSRPTCPSCNRRRSSSSSI
jgi:ABC transporter substrate binding protein